MHHFEGILFQAERDKDARALHTCKRELRDWAIKCERPSEIRNTLKMAESDFRVERKAFEYKPWVIGFQNGTWTNGQFREHRKSDYLLELCPISYNPDADRTQLLEVLKVITGDDPEFARTLQSIAGYALSGSSRLKFLLWLYGARDTGKGTYLYLLERTLGDHLSAVLSPKDLDTRGFPDRDRLGAKMWNRRLVTCQELGRARIDGELLKTLSGGGDMITVRFLRQEAFTARPTHVLAMVSNSAPQLPAFDEALRKRIIALPFHHRLDINNNPLLEGKDIKDLASNTNSELMQGFLAWAVEGLEDVHTCRQLYLCPAVVRATKQFWEDVDPTTDFWLQLEIDLTQGISKSQLRRSYETWCDEEGIKPLNRNQWTKACELKGLVEQRLGKQRTKCWIKADRTFA